MSWETRNGRGRYYTRSRRVGGRIVREYIGCEPVAALVAQIDLQERRIRMAEADQKRARKAEEVALDDLVDEVARTADLLARGVLLAAGYHDHRGEWRKARGRTKPGSG